MMRVRPFLRGRRRVAFALPAAALLALCGGYFAAEAAPQERVIKLTVKRFEYSQKEIVLKRGQPVVIEITSLDVPHGFSVPDFNVRADIVLPGKVTRVKFTPDREGTFVFLCDIFCGTLHEQVDGRFIVRS
jgi:cytochrome c oxidase subunit II